MLLNIMVTAILNVSINMSYVCFENADNIKEVQTTPQINNPQMNSVTSTNIISHSLAL